ncbi:MAG: OmpA family protein [Bacteroidetes bacterium]|nr:OmpA family protein [Bacteroidota bacterium]
MKALKFITITFLLSINYLSAQNKNSEKEFDDAEKIFSKISDSKSESLTSTKGAYAEVLPVFLNLYKQDPTNMNLAFKIGMCYQSARRDRVKAIGYFNKAVTSTANDTKPSSYKEKRAPFIAFKYLGDAYHWNYEFDKAITAYQQYISVAEKNNATDKTVLAETNRKIDMCKVGQSLVANPVKIKIQNLGNTVNSPYADYSGIFSADQNTLFFTSRRPQTTGGEKDNEGNYMEDIYTSSKTKNGWSTAQNIGAPINTEWHEATVGVSPDAQMILIYKDDMGDGNIYSTSLDGDVWSKPVKLNDNINTKHWEPSAFISADGNSLYFSSNKPGGFGGLDLYMSKRGSDGDWGKAINLGANINTTYDEDAPSIHPDGVTLSFSSNGHNTMGGFDIFSSLLSFDGNWSAPVNVGYPINTTDDDIFYMVSPNGKTAYFSSFRADGLGEKDNYMATFLDRKETPLTLIQGTVNDEAGMPAKKVMITVTDNETEEIVGVYKANAKTGQFLFILTPGKNYNITYQAENHLFYSENMEIPKQSTYYEVKRSVKLHPIVVGSKITLNNIFFDFDKATLRPLSNVELKNLVMLMRSNPNMKVEISGHTDSKGDDAYNLKLSEERAQAVVTRLIEKGITTEHMKAKGYGETQPVAPNTKPNGSDDPEGRQLNRRVELKITEL